MKLLLITIMLNLLLSIFGYSQNTNGKTLRVNPDDAIGGRVSQLIDSVLFIPLESSGESVFGLVDQLSVTDKYFIILDRQTNAVLIFEKNGKYHAKIEGKKIGYPEGRTISAFYYDKSTNLIQISKPLRSNQTPLVQCFDTDGKFVKDMEVLSSYNYINLNKNEKIYYNRNVDNYWKDSIAYELTITDKNKITKKYFPYNMHTDNLKSRDIFYNNPLTSRPTKEGAFYFVRPYDYKIYSILPDTLKTAYQFIFPAAYSLPENFITDSSFNYKRRRFIKENKDVIYQLSNVCQVNNHLFFKAFDHSSSNTYLYSLISQNIYCINKISPDWKSYFLPVTDALTHVSFKNTGFLDNYDDFLFVSYSSLTLFQQKEQTEDKRPQYPPVLVKYFKDKKNEKGNPVIIQMRFKTNL